jgi:hypothetical protein
MIRKKHLVKTLGLMRNNYPKPTGDFLNLTLGEGEQPLLIYNINGQLLKTQSQAGGFNFIDRPSLYPRFFLLKVWPKAEEKNPT